MLITLSCGLSALISAARSAVVLVVLLAFSAWRSQRSVMADL
jgi:hypothetical protein